MVFAAKNSERWRKDKATLEAAIADDEAALRRALGDVERAVRNKVSVAPRVRRQPYRALAIACGIGFTLGIVSTLITSSTSHHRRL